MYKPLIILASLLLSAKTSFAANVNISIFGPLETDLLIGEPEATNLCIGAIHCGSPAVSGLSLSLFANTSQGPMKGASITFGANVARSEGMKGLQLAYLSNISTGKAQGAQLSLLTNIQTEELAGLQFGLINVLTPSAEPEAKEEGEEEGEGENEDEQSDQDVSSPLAVQYGLINISNQENTVTLGLLNIVRGGRFDIALETGVFGYNRIALTQGGRYFYSILLIEAEAFNTSKKRKNFHRSKEALRDYGLGLAIPLNERSSLRAEFIRHSPTFYDIDKGELIRLLYERTASDYIRLYAGLEQFTHYGREHTDGIPSQKFPVAFTAGIGIRLLGGWK